MPVPTVPWIETCDPPDVIVGVATDNRTPSLAVPVLVPPVPETFTTPVPVDEIWASLVTKTP